RAGTLYRRYRTRALDLLDEALKQVPDRNRREEILNDPALRPLRLRPRRSPAVSGAGGSFLPPNEAGVQREGLSRGRWHKGFVPKTVSLDPSRGWIPGGGADFPVCPGLARQARMPAPPRKERLHYG